MWAHKVSCEAYQELLDRGWRRSGQWLYRPLPDKQAACHCHPYTIRLDTAQFMPSKVNFRLFPVSVSQCTRVCRSRQIMPVMHGGHISSEIALSSPNSY